VPVDPNASEQKSVKWNGGGTHAADLFGGFVKRIRVGDGRGTFH